MADRRPRLYDVRAARSREHRQGVCFVKRHLSATFGFSVLAFALALGTRVPLQAQPPAGQAPPAPVAGQTASQRYKNIQVLKDVPADQLRLAMDYITASLGVGCD